MKTADNYALFNDWYVSFYEQEFASKLTYTSVGFAGKLVKFMIEALKRASGAEFTSCLKIYDQCCGSGSFAFAVDKLGLGNKVVGVDIAEPARRLARLCDDRPNLKFHWADVLKYVEPEEFDICTCWHTSCCYSLDDANNLLQFKRMSECLKPGGLFIVDTINLEHVKANFIEKRADILDDDTIVARWYELAGNDLSSKWRVYKQDGTHKTFYGHTRLYSLGELVKMLFSVDLHVLGSAGSYEFDPVSLDFGRMILYGVKV